MASIAEGVGYLEDGYFRSMDRSCTISDMRSGNFHILSTTPPLAVPIDNIFENNYQNNNSDFYQDNTIENEEIIRNVFHPCTTDHNFLSECTESCEIRSCCNRENMTTASVNKNVYCEPE